MPSVQYVTGYRDSLTFTDASSTVTGGVASTPVTSSFTQADTYIGMATVNGTTVHAMSQTDSGAPSYTYVYYAGVSGNTVTDYGGDNVTAASGTETVRYMASVDFGIAVGQSKSYSYTRVQTNSAGTVISSPAVSGSYTLAAVESVATGLGTFSNACKITFAETTANTGYTTTDRYTMWLAQGTGIVLKYVSTSVDSRTPTQTSSYDYTLSTGSINGVTIAAR